MVNPFKKPFKPNETSRDKFISTLIFGLFIFMFLFLFKPFGLDELKPVQEFFISFGYGLVTIFVLFIFKYLFEPVITKRNWTLGKNLLWDLSVACSIGMANAFYICLVFHQPFIFKYLLFGIWTALLVGSIPVSIHYIIIYNRIYKAALAEAAIPPEKIFGDNEIILQAGNIRNELRINPKNIIYLCSNDNYVTVVTSNGEIPGKTTIRGTLKAAESELQKSNRFIRCHKCYLVNLDFVGDIKGNNQNMTLRLIPSGIEIPVSRSKAGLLTRSLRKH